MNTLQSFVFNVFYLLLQTDMKVAQAVFFSIKSDAGQRDATKAAAAAILTTPEEGLLLEKLNAKLDAISRLSGERNAFIHTLWMMEMPSKRITPSMFSVPQPRLQVSRVTEQGDDLIKRIYDLVMPMGVLATEVSSAPSIQRLREGRRKAEK